MQKNVIANIRLVVYVLVATCALVLTGNGVAHAEVERGLTIYPLRTELAIPAGIAQSGYITVKNSTSEPMDVSMSAEEFKVINSHYDYEFLATSNVASWASFIPSSMQLKAGQEMKVKYTIGIPLSIEPGGRYISMFASSSISGSGSRQRVASLLYITVPGDVLGESDVSGRLLSLSSPWLVVNRGVWSALVQNVGVNHYRSYYDVRLEDIFGNVINKMSDSALILPNTIRSISGEVPLPTAPGLYKLVYSVGLNEVRSVDIICYILYLPPWAVAVLVIIIVILSYLLYLKLRHKH